MPSRRMSPRFSANSTILTILTGPSSRNWRNGMTRSYVPGSGSGLRVARPEKSRIRSAWHWRRAWSMLTAGMRRCWRRILIRTWSRRPVPVFTRWTGSWKPFPRDTGAGWRWITARRMPPWVYRLRSRHWSRFASLTWWMTGPWVVRLMLFFAAMWLYILQKKRKGH